MSSFFGLQFEYAAVLRELTSMRELSAPFLDDGSKWVWNHCESTLRNLQNSEKGGQWSIDKDNAIRTIVSNGAYRANDEEGGQKVYGILSFVWDIQNTDKGRKQKTHFILNGMVSTSVEVKTVEDDSLVAKWQLEGGDASSPGCHFHSAVNQYGDYGLFPEWLKVPRFPGLLLMPFDGLEFLLGELFQLDWHRHVSESTYHRDFWSAAQQRRLQKILGWQLKQVNDYDTTPWMSLKKAKPSLGLLL
jgi:hypothetical protein